MHKGIKLPCHFNKATLYTTFNQCHCAENGSSPSSAASDLSWLSNYTASSASFSLLRDSVRMSQAQLAISDKHAWQQTGTPATTLLLAFCKLSIGSSSARTLPPSCLSGLEPTPTHTQACTHGHTCTCTHTRLHSTHSLLLSLRKPVFSGQDTSL